MALCWPDGDDVMAGICSGNVRSQNVRCGGGLLERSIIMGYRTRSTSVADAMFFIIFVSSPQAQPNEITQVTTITANKKCLNDKYTKNAFFSLSLKSTLTLN